jgi:hypothetical protein
MKKPPLVLAALLISFRLVSQSCLPAGIDFNTQAQVDNFQADYPGCTQVEGGVEINGDDITNLDGLSVLTSIGTYLYLTNNDNLNDLSGLASLSTIGGALLISTNSSLVSLAGLENVTAVAADVFISNNPVLSDISALANINAANVTELRITGNVALATCDNTFICNYLGDPNGKVIIYNNAPGCNNPPEIAADCGITLGCLPFGNYNFYTQADIDGFQGTYPGCYELEGTVKISGADITSLQGLNVVTSINGSLEIHNNIQLQSLAGLDSMVLINGALTIVGNTILTDISALGSIDTAALTFLGINNNPALAECNIQSFCDYLFGPFGSAHYNIMGNADGCKTRDEVMLACTVGVEEISWAEESHFLITPNPASTKITIETLEISSQFLISIFNLSGQEVIRQTSEETSTIIDISNLNPGVYFVRLEGEKDVWTEKFIKLD